jgi:O-antigen ligase
MLILDGKFLEYNSNDILGVTVDRLIPRMTGTTTDPNFLALYMTPLFFYLFAKRDKRAGEKLLFLLSIVAIALTLSRGGIISILLTLALYKISKVLTASKITIPRNLIAKSIFIIGTALVLFLILMKTSIGNEIEHMLLKRFNLFSLQRASGRFNIWRNGFLLFQENPLLGIGIYNFIYYNSTLFGDYHYMHNTHLEVLVESGIVGFSLYVIFHLMLLYSIYKLQRTRRHVHVFLIYVSMQLQMTSLSAIINPVWILFLAYTSFVIEKELKKEKRRV